MIEIILMMLVAGAGMIVLIALVFTVWLAKNFAKDQERMQQIEDRTRASMIEHLIKARAHLKELDRKIPKAKGKKRRELEKQRLKTVEFIAFLEANMGRV